MKASEGKNQVELGRRTAMTDDEKKKQFVRDLETLISKGKSIPRQTITAEGSGDPIIDDLMNYRPTRYEVIDASAGTSWCTEARLFLASQLPPAFPGSKELLAEFRYPPSTAEQLEGHIACLSGLITHVKSYGL
jgi:hypothetical protein